MSVYTAIRPTTDCAPRNNGQDPNIVVLHHTAGVMSIDALVSMMMPGGRTMSAHAAIKDRDIVSVVPESKRAYALSDGAFDSRALNAECINSTGGPAWELSDATHESIARWVADVCKRHGIRPHRDGPQKTWTVIGHREVNSIHGAGYATACPGGMRLNWIVERAQDLMKSKPKKRPTQGEEPMSAAYLFAPAAGDKPARYALVGLDVPGGSFVTTTVAQAQAIGFVYGVRPDEDGVGAKNGGPIKQINQKQLDDAIALYAKLRAAKVAEEKANSAAGPAAPTPGQIADEFSARLKA